MFLEIAGPPNRLVPGIVNALSVGFCILGFGTLGAFVPERPGDPVYDFLNLSGPAQHVDWPEWLCYRRW